MKKRVPLIIGLVAVLAFALAACGGNSSGGAATGSADKGGGTAAAITSPTDFSNHIIAVQVATTAADSIDKMVADGTIKNVDVRRYEKITQCFDDLKLGRVDAVYVDSVVASYYTKDNTDYQRVWTNSTGEPMGICLAKGSEKLEAAIEAAIDTMYYDGTIKGFANKDFGDDFTAGLRNVTAQPTIPKDFTTITPGTLTVGLEGGYPPMEYADTDGQTLIGFDIDVANQIGKLLGLKVTFVNTAWDGIFAGLGKGQYDCIISSVSITPDRQANYLLTKPYVENRLCIVTAAGK
ncbi:MAG: transporter substrate-binding domain-containing protein [Clostridiales bacterium]|nr:transporter substrate-binding domain-containing protein [Clostridiales bacterium]